MRFYIDTEFVEDGYSIDLISIALVAEDGREYYAVSTQFNQRKAKRHKFVATNVLPKLPLRDTFEHSSPNQREKARAWKSRERIAADIREFVGNAPEFWGDYASYDWIALCQLYGTMDKLPETWPYFIRDIQQWAVSLSIHDLPSNPAESAHDALSDANECKMRYDYLKVKFTDWVTTR